MKWINDKNALKLELNLIRQFVALALQAEIDSKFPYKEDLLLTLSLFSTFENQLLTTAVVAEKETYVEEFNKALDLLIQKIESYKICNDK